MSYQDSLWKQEHITLYNSSLYSAKSRRRRRGFAVERNCTPIKCISSQQNRQREEERQGSSLIVQLELMHLACLGYYYIVANGECNVIIIMEDMIRWWCEMIALTYFRHVLTCAMVFHRIIISVFTPFVYVKYDELPTHRTYILLVSRLYHHGVKNFVCERLSILQLNERH